MPVTPARRLVVMALATTALAGCEQVKSTFASLRGSDNSPPDSLPQLLNDSLPFDYPIGLYLQLIDDSVTLRLHVDQFGRPVPESTRVEVHAKYPQFDTAAVDGARELLFRPAIRKGKEIPYTVLFPIQFKVPLLPVVPKDSTSQ